MAAKRYGVSCWAAENVLKSDNVDGCTLLEYTKNY